MTGSASGIVEDYLSRLRVELGAAGAVDTEDLVAEVRSLLADAVGVDSDSAAAEIARLGEPAELARAILAERGLDASGGMSPGLWWRLGIAAPIDVAIGLALPVAAALPLYVAAAFGEPRFLSVMIVIALGFAVLAWPFFIWRPWRRGGRALSPGMTLTGLAVVRAPGFWRLARIDELKAMGLAPRRRVAGAVLVALVAVVLLVSAALVGVDAGGSWLASAAISAEFSGQMIGGGVPLRTQLQNVVSQVYIGLESTPGPQVSTAWQYITPEASDAFDSLWARIGTLKIRDVQVGTPRQISPGVYRVDVAEFDKGGELPATQVGTSTFTLGQRQWLRGNGVGSDWAVVGIQVGAASTGQ
jgi:hypothetical protein